MFTSIVLRLSIKKRGGGFFLSVCSVEGLLSANFCRHLTQTSNVTPFCLWMLSPVDFGRYFIVTVPLMLKQSHIKIMFFFFSYTWHQVKIFPSILFSNKVKSFCSGHICHAHPPCSPQIFKSLFFITSVPWRMLSFHAVTTHKHIFALLGFTRR